MRNIRTINFNRAHPRPNWFPIVVCLLAGFGLAGCGLLKQPPVAKGYFSIDAGEPQDVSGHVWKTRPHAPVLRVDRLRISPPYDAVAFVYRLSPTQFDTDYYNNFIAPPASLLTGSLIQWLDRSGSLMIVDTSSSLGSQWRLEGEITALYIDSAAKPMPVAVVAGRFFLIREQQGEDQVISETTFQETAPVSAKSAAGFAAAFGQAWRQVLIKISAALNKVGPTGHSNTTSPAG